MRTSPLATRSAEVALARGLGLKKQLSEPAELRSFDPLVADRNGALALVATSHVRQPRPVPPRNALFLPYASTLHAQPFNAHAYIHTPIVQPFARQTKRRTRPRRALPCYAAAPPTPLNTPQYTSHHAPSSLYTRHPHIYSHAPFTHSIHTLHSSPCIPPPPPYTPHAHRSPRPIHTRGSNQYQQYRTIWRRAVSHQRPSTSRLAPSTLQSTSIRHSGRAQRLFTPMHTLNPAPFAGAAPSRDPRRRLRPRFGRRAVPRPRAPPPLTLSR